MLMMGGECCYVESSDIILIYIIYNTYSAVCLC